jgi:hypothetical protein
MASFWRRLQRWFGFKQIVTPRAVEELPDDLAPNLLYLVGAGSQPWSAAMLCPCGCRSLIQLSLIADDDPRWKLNYESSGRVTLHPSIWRIKGCRSHFFVRSNVIIWARDAVQTRRAPKDSHPGSRSQHQTTGRG